MDKGKLYHYVTTTNSNKARTRNIILWYKVCLEALASKFQWVIQITYGQCRMSSGWLVMLPCVIRMRWLFWSQIHPDDLAIGSISSRWLMGIAGCHPDDLRYRPISSGWHNIIWTLSHPDETAPARISCGWLKVLQYVIWMTSDSALCHPDEITILIPKSSGWRSYRQYLIRVTNDIVLSHADDIRSFEL